MRSRLRVSVAVLLVLASAIFAIGVAVERSQPDPHDESASQASTNAAEGSDAREDAERLEGAASNESAEKSSEEFLGINTESTGLVIAAVVISLLLALAAVTVRSPLVLVLIVIVALGATTFDIMEVLHQIDESRDGVAALATLTAALHGLTALGAVGSLLSEQGRDGANERVEPTPAG